MIACRMYGFDFMTPNLVEGHWTGGCEADGRNRFSFELHIWLHELSMLVNVSGFAKLTRHDKFHWFVRLCQCLLKSDENEKN